MRAAREAIPESTTRHAVELVSEAMRMLRKARDLLRDAEAPRAAWRVSAVLTSAGGARRYILP